MKNWSAYLGLFISLCLLCLGGYILMTGKKNDFHVEAALKEELTQKPLQIKGNIPVWLEGTLVRNGPIQVSVNGKQNSHWFDGLAMLHAFAFSNGQVIYTNKFLRTDAYHAVFDEGSLEYSGFAVDPCRSIFKRFFTWLTHTGPEIQNANINVAYLADQYVALYETPLPVQFDEKTLDTLGVFNYQDELPKEKCWESAHPHHDSEKQETINYLIDYGRTSYYTVYRMRDGSATREIIAKIPVEEPAYMHSFGVTENYIVLTEFPLVVYPLDLITKGKAFIKNFVWKPERGTQFIVIDRHNGQVVKKATTQAFFAFHHANAYERGNELIVDIVAYPDARIISGVADYDRLDSKREIPETESLPQLRRYIFDLAEGKIAMKTIFSDTLEFPRFNEGVHGGKPYRFVYAVDGREAGSVDESRSIYKINVDDGKVLKWEEKGCFPGEPIFVRHLDAKEEDDGVILTVVLNEKQQNTFLLILNSKTFEEIGRAVVEHKIPAGLHGQFF